jgi:hypothetical protein
MKLLGENATVKNELEMMRDDLNALLEQVRDDEHRVPFFPSPLPRPPLAVLGGY